MLGRVAPVTQKKTGAALVTNLAVQMGHVGGQQISENYKYMFSGCNKTSFSGAF